MLTMATQRRPRCPDPAAGLRSVHPRLSSTRHECVCECVCCCVTSLHSINKRWSIAGFFSGPSRTSWVTTWLDRASQPLMSCFPLKDQPHVFKGFSCKEHVSLSWSEFQNRLKTLATLCANFQRTQTFYFFRIFFLFTYFFITHHVAFYKDIVLFTHVSLYFVLCVRKQQQQQHIFGSYKEICDCIYENLFMEIRFPNYIFFKKTFKIA